jgi:hypothetical protein
VMGEGRYHEMYDCDFGSQSVTPASLHAKPGYWRVRDGALLKITDMTVSHLDNAIKLFERAGFGKFAKIQELRAERAKR